MSSGIKSGDIVGISVLENTPDRGVAAPWQMVIRNVLMRRILSLSMCLMELYLGHAGAVISALFDGQKELIITRRERL